MGKPTLHQFIIGASPGDAITDQALLLQRWLREEGFHSELFAEGANAALSDQVHSYLGYRPSQSGEVVILHHSIGSAVVDYLLSLDVRFLLIYHNITPPQFFNMDPALAVQLSRGMEQLTLLRERTLLGLADSAYNEHELQRAGFSSTAILPIVLDESRYQMESDPALLACYQGGGPHLLFVGRLVPNKRQEELIKLLYHYRRIEPAAGLILVGASWLPAYTEWLQDLAHELGLGESVIFTDHVSQRDMVTYYRLADVYVSMSEHEGFGKPLIESMYLGLPVLAYAAAAVPDTLGGAGVMFHEKNYEALAEVVDILVRDSHLRQRIMARQRERARAFLEPAVRQIWQNLQGAWRK